MNNWKEQINFNEEKFRQDTDTIELQDIEIVEEAIQTLKQFYLSKEDGFRRVEKISLLAINLLMKQLEAYENMRKEAIEELSKDYKNLPDIDEWYATDKQWHNYYFEKSEQDDYKIENTLNILNKVGGNDE